MVGPDVAEHEGPDADENVDEYFDRRRGAQNPARLVVDAFGRVLREDQRLGNAAGGDGGAVGLNGKAHPGAGDQRLMRQECLRDERQDQDFDHGEDDDQGRHQHRHDRPCADGTADSDRRGDTADRDAGGQRRRPFTIEAEPLAGHEINHRPVDQVRFDDGGDAAQDQRTRQTELARRSHREYAAENDDRDFDVKLRPNCFFERFSEAGKKLAMISPAISAKM